MADDTYSPLLSLQQKAEALQANVKSGNVGALLTSSALDTTVAGLAQKAVTGAAGYYVGGSFGHPVIGCLVSLLFGLPGMFGLALFATPVAVPNRRRRARKGGRR